jgi:hypothetical protein
MTLRLTQLERSNDGAGGRDLCGHRHRYRGRLVRAVVDTRGRTQVCRDGCRFEQTMTGELSKTEDAKAAAAAFVEKRKPVFKGR